MEHQQLWRSFLKAYICSSDYQRPNSFGISASGTYSENGWLNAIALVETQRPTGCTRGQVEVGLHLLSSSTPDTLGPDSLSLSCPKSSWDGMQQSLLRLSSQQPEGCIPFRISVQRWHAEWRLSVGCCYLNNNVATGRMLWVGDPTMMRRPELFTHDFIVSWWILLKLVGKASVRSFICSKYLVVLFTYWVFFLVLRNKKWIRLTGNPCSRFHF